MSIETMTDQELIEIIVREQVSTIQAQKRFANNPMAMPPHTPEQRQRRDAMWNECIKRGVHTEVNRRVKAIAAGMVTE